MAKQDSNMNVSDDAIKLLNILDELKEAIIANDIEAIIQSIDRLKIDSRYSNPVCTYASKVILSAIVNHIEQKNGKPLKVIRKGEYGTKVTDYYEIVNGVLKRNGTDAKWTSLGKLYQAYKFINLRK